MRRHNFQHCNPYKYEKHMSPFGKKVLNVLIKQWNTDPVRKGNLSQIQTRRYPAQNRILTFRDSNISETPVQMREQLNSANDLSDARPFQINLLKHNLPPAYFVPTSGQLVKTETIISNENYYLSRDDLINSTVMHNNIKSQNYVEGTNELTPYINNPFTDEANNQTSAIDWNDMFDTELFPEINVAMAAILDDTGKDVSKEKQFQIQFPAHSETTIKSDKLLKRNTDKEIKHENIKKMSKRKNQTKITDTVPKKVKNIATECSKTIIKNKFRKQKYTKTVKNWLNNVDSSNNVEEETLDSPGLEKNQTKIKNKREELLVNAETFIPSGISKVEINIKDNVSKPVITIEKACKEKSKKKIVQAQLANKDGIMKFGIPECAKNNDKSKSQDIVMEKIQGTDQDNVHKYKKTKPQFVAPIKSQIPVKDVLFEIHTIDTATSSQYVRQLCNFERKEVIAVLVYSNGFCQLNNHHTDDTCNVEGIMFHVDDEFYYLKGNDEIYREILEHILKQNHIICYDGKNILVYLMSQFQMEFNEALNIADAKIGGSLVDADNPPKNFSELQKLLNFTAQYTVATECILQKSAWYMTLLKDCMSMLKSVLMEDSLWKVFTDIEMRLLPIIADMERRGVRVDLEKLKSMENIILTRIKKVEQECFKAAGKVFQINSSVQVGTILYNELQLDTKCNIKIRETISKGAKSTSETMLRNLVSAHPLPKLILEYRRLHKAHATFLAGIAQHVKDGVVKPTWVQTAAATGRVASNNPNLQAIPKAPFSLFPEDEDNAPQVLALRSVYTARAGHVLLAADFHHVECRVFAHIAADAELLAALHSGRDLFKVLAAKWLNKPESEVSCADRERTKRIVYASLYGAGPRKLMDILRVPYEQALAVSASFNATFPALRRFGAAMRGGGARPVSLGGRARRLPLVDSADSATRAHAHRQALNFVVQGSAADLCKLAMVACEESVRAARPPLAARLVLQIHDELVWEVQADQLYHAAALIKQAMEGCGRRLGMELPLPVALSAGASWGDMAELTLPPSAQTPAL